MIYDHALHSIRILIMFHAFNVCLNVENCILVGLDWVQPMMQLFLAHHMFMHFSCIHTLSFLFIFSVCDVSLFLPLSLSLSRIDFAWHLSANLLRLETLLVPSLLLIFLHPLFMFGFMMGRPSRTSLRTFRNVAFIRNAMSFCRTFPTLFYPVSFELGDGNLFVRYH